MEHGQYGKGPRSESSILVHVRVYPEPYQPLERELPDVSVTHRKMESWGDISALFQKVLWKVSGAQYHKDENTL
jgi:hypothetical protein